MSLFGFGGGSGGGGGSSAAAPSPQMEMATAEVRVLPISRLFAGQLCSAVSSEQAVSAMQRIRKEVVTTTATDTLSPIHTARHDHRHLQPPRLLVPRQVHQQHLPRAGPQQGRVRLHRPVSLSFFFTSSTEESESAHDPRPPPVSSSSARPYPSLHRSPPPALAPAPPSGSVRSYTHLASSSSYSPDLTAPQINTRRTHARAHARHARHSCVAKFFAVNQKVGERMTALGAGGGAQQQGAGGPSLFGR